ncbi:Rid family detoxifying hydrolase [Flavitalea flava]
MQPIETTGSARLPFTEAVRTENQLYISGQIGSDPVSGALIKNSFRSEAEQVMENIGNVLKRNSLDYHHLVMVVIYLTDMENYAETNEVYTQFFSSVFPARVCIAVKELPLKANIEISAIARLVTGLK